MQQHRPVYLRGIPARLVREAKAAAARRGSTLAALVSDALERTLQEHDAKQDAAGEFRDAMRWYERNRPRLLSRYRGEYVAIVDRRVVDHDTTFDSLAARVFARLGVRSVFMPRVQEGMARLRIRSPRLRH